MCASLARVVTAGRGCHRTFIALPFASTPDPSERLAATHGRGAAWGPRRTAIGHLLLLDPTLSDDARRRALYAGDILLYSPRPSARALCEFARGMLEEAFRPHPPELAQHHLPVAEYVRIAAALKPAFIHHPESKRLVRELLLDFGCDPERTYFDVPRLRSSTSHGYLTTGIAYAFHPHRDTWYSAPTCQINWWLPIDALAPDNGLAFHPSYFDRAIANSSRLYDYDEWNRTSRYTAAEQVGVDTRVQPRAEEELDLSDELRVVTGAAALQAFSGAQLHASVENTSGCTRYSIDFRTVHGDDAEAGIGARNTDARCTGTAIGDFLRCTDLSHLPAATIERHRAGLGR